MLFWVYVCPPLACIFMGRPFSACLASILCLFFWLPGVSYAKTIYVDYKTNNHMSNLTGAIRGKPETKKEARRLKAAAAEEARQAQLIDKPHVGVHGTKFKRIKD